MEAKKSGINQYGQPILSINELCEVLLQGKSIDRTFTEESEDLNRYLEYKDDLLKKPAIISLPASEISVDSYHEQMSDTWLIPNEYKEIDVLGYLIKKCKSQEQINRVEEEYALYSEKDLVMLLRLFIYLVDYMRNNNFVWGVGRGSSVSSYILYLIGVHRVDSIKYNLDVKDYLK